MLMIQTDAMKVHTRLVAVLLALSSVLAGRASAEPSEWRVHVGMTRPGSTEQVQEGTAIIVPFGPDEIALPWRAQGPKVVRSLIRTSAGREFVMEWWQAPDGEHSRVRMVGLESEIEVVDLRGSDSTKVRVGDEQFTVPDGADEEEFLENWRSIRTPSAWTILNEIGELVLTGTFPQGGRHVRTLFCADPPPDGSPRGRCEEARHLEQTFLPPDCNFDSSLGFPCNRGQVLRAIDGGIDKSLDPDATLRQPGALWY